MNKFVLLVNSTNILSNSSQTLTFMRPQQSIQKINPSLPPLTPRITQSTIVHVSYFRLFSYFLKIYSFDKIFVESD